MEMMMILQLIHINLVQQALKRIEINLILRKMSIIYYLVICVLHLGEEIKVEMRNLQNNQRSQHQLRLRNLHPLLFKQNLPKSQKLLNQKKLSPKNLSLLLPKKLITILSRNQKLWRKNKWSKNNLEIQGKLTLNKLLPTSIIMFSSTDLDISENSRKLLRILTFINKILTSTDSSMF